MNSLIALLAGSAAFAQPTPAQTEPAQQYEDMLQCIVYYAHLEGTLKVLQEQTTSDAKRSYLAAAHVEVDARSKALHSEFTRVRKAYKRRRIDVGDDLDRATLAVLAQSGPSSGKSFNETFRIMLDRTKACDAQFTSPRKK